MEVHCNMKPVLILNCSFQKEKEYKKWFGDLIQGKMNEASIASTSNVCLPVFRCTDMVRVAGTKNVVEEVYYSPKCYSPSQHARLGTLYGNSYTELYEVIESLKQLEDKNK
jgi:hypothetical protein